MRCEDNLCIYQTKGRCVLRSISIDHCGGCSECTHVLPSEKLLKELKQRARLIYRGIGDRDGGPLRR